MAEVTRGQLPMSHAALQEAVTDLCDWYGIWWWHDNDSRRNKAGLPDLWLIGEQHTVGDRPAELWRELKVPPDKLKPAQEKLGRRCVAAGIDWGVWTPDDLRSDRIRRELAAIRPSNAAPGSSPANRVPARRRARTPGKGIPR